MHTTITKPTRITENSATLIDNIFTNDFKDTLNHYQGILYNDMSDHFPVYHLDKYQETNNSSEKYVWKRKINDKSIENFQTELQNINWDDVLSSHEANSTYSLLHNKLLRIYDKFFPLKRYKVNSYTARLPWLTDALRKSIAHKNDLYRKQKKSNIALEIEHYKKYKNKLSKILRSAERKHYATMIEEHKSDLKKSWSILKNILN